MEYAKHQKTIKQLRITISIKKTELHAICSIEAIHGRVWRLDGECSFR